jgi:hypothetical protein
MKPETSFEKWRGGRARLWEYSVSHKKLTVRVEFAGRDGNLHISCLDVSFVHGPTEWSNASFEIEWVAPDCVVLRDRNAQFEVQAAGVDVAENCKPIYSAPRQPVAK